MADLETKNRTLAVNLQQSEAAYKQKLAAVEVGAWSACGCLFRLQHTAQLQPQSESVLLHLAVPFLLPLLGRPAQGQQRCRAGAEGCCCQAPTLPAILLAAHAD